ncbi:uncharacterized protein LOC124279783 [Haliotis rubra]|uniref:uncharacterized protein LOC124279783 n=1 Tax=Haliotis rubra TaxID=36100 RepID=UPI001EE627B8|nr:uncharacterized protein LOC124279783 [Haliotis rubra]
MTIGYIQRSHGPCNGMSENKTNGTCSDSQLQKQLYKTTIYDFEIVQVGSSPVNTRKSTEYGVSGLKRLNIPTSQEREQTGTTIHQESTIHQERTAYIHCQQKRFALLNNQRPTEKYINSHVIYYNAPNSKSGSKINEVETDKYTVLVYGVDTGNRKSYTTGDKTHTKWESPVCMGSRKVQVQQCVQEGRHLKQEASEFHNGRYVSKSERLRFSDNLICFHISLFVTSQKRTEFEHNYDRGYEDHQCVNTWKNKTNVTKENENVYTCWKQHPSGSMCEEQIGSNQPTLFSDLEHEQIQGMTDSHPTALRLSIQKEPNYHTEFGIVFSGVLADTQRASITKEHRPTPLECDIKATSRSVSELCALYDLTDVHETHEEFGNTSTTHSDTYLYHQSSPFPTKETETAESKLPSKDMFRHFDIDSYIQSLPIPTVAPFFSLQSYFEKIANHEHVSNDDKMLQEGLRLSSFSNINVNASCIRLAAAGFYATGKGDETKCFSCGVRHSCWRKGDNIFVIHKHISPTCLHALGTDQRNIPIHPPPIHDTASRPVVLDDSEGAVGMALVMHKTLDVITQTDGPQPTMQVNSTNGALFESAIRNVLENSNRHLDTSNKCKPSGESVKDDHTRAFASVSDEGVHSPPFQTSPESVSEDGNNTPDLPVSSGATVIRSFERMEPIVQSDSATRSHNNLEMNSLRFDNAVYPNYLDISTRLASFLLWPNDHCKKPAELAEAGFFCAGFSDCVRCFVCGVGLKTWEKGDNPWVEHVRWRASCTYVRVTKGEAFITQTLAMEGQRRREHEIPGSINQAGNAAADVGDVLEREGCQRALEMGYSRNCVSKHALDILRNENHTLTLDVLLVHILAEEDLEMSASTELNYNEPTADSGSIEAIAPISRTTLHENNQLMIGEAVVGRFQTQSDNGHTQGPNIPTKATAVGSKIPSISVLGTEQKHKQNKEVRQKDLEADAAKTEIPRGHADETLICPGQKHSRHAYENTVPDEDEGYGESSEMSEERVFQSLPVMPSGNRSINKPKKAICCVTCVVFAESTKEQRKAAEEETQQLKESNVCKICLEDPANIVFLPCGHLVACAVCAPALERCPVCRKHIRGSVRVHLATHLKNKIQQS